MDEIDISPYSLRDEFSLNEAAYLWAGLLPTMRISERKAYPAKMAAAREWGRILVEAAKKGDLHVAMPPEGTKTTNQLLREACEARNSRMRESLGSWEWTVRDSPRFGVHRRDAKPPEPPWSLARVTRERLKVFAQSLGQCPAFLFPDDAPREAETAVERNRRIAAAVIDGEMTKAQAEAEGVKPDNLKRILSAERKRRRESERDGKTSASDKTANPMQTWALHTTIRPQTGIAKPSPTKKAIPSKT